jgi:hypothetical protein
MKCIAFFIAALCATSPTFAQSELNVSIVSGEFVQPAEPPPAVSDEPAPPAPGPIESETDTSTDAAKPPTTKPKPPAPPSPYKGVYYDNDFAYLTAANNEYFYCGDGLKRNALGKCWLLDFGGEYRLRHHHEVNLRGSNLSGASDDFLLHRTRLFANMEYGNWFRFYGEAIDAVSEFEDLPPRNIEENRFDALNLFVDGLLYDTCQGQWRGRIGRQESTVSSGSSRRSIGRTRGARSTGPKSLQKPDLGPRRFPHTTRPILAARR